jgi:hypothetical protein
MPHIPSPTDKFRINMAVGYGPNTPANPPPTPPATSWYDVSDWQSFLVGLGCLTSGTYADDDFGVTTKTATMTFQTSAAFGVVLPGSGIVTLATYNKAVAAGMTPYPHT